MNKKPLTDAQLLAQAKKVGRLSEFEDYRRKILQMLDSSINEGQEDYAAFLFAYSSIANEVRRRKFSNKTY